MLTKEVYSRTASAGLNMRRLATTTIPMVAALTGMSWKLPRCRRIYCGYYVGHLAILVAFAI